MRRSMIRRWALPAIFWAAIEDGAQLCAEVPPGPKWLQTAVFYQIYPQSYYDSNGDGIGDLPGITAKLDYINSVGCNAIWLNPIFESPFGDAGYDVADFYRVAARYGTNDNFNLSPVRQTVSNTPGSGGAAEQQRPGTSLLL